MNFSPISSLPPEVLHEILTYLPIETLLIFGRTSKRNYSAATQALQNLRLAILPRQMHGTLAFLSTTTFEEIDTDVGDVAYDNPCRNQVLVTSPLPSSFNETRSRTKRPAGPTPAQHREKLIQLQNALACSVLSTPTLVSLTSFSLYIYHIISPALTEILATSFPNLKELRLNFHHPYLHDSCLPAQYWSNPIYLEPSPIWNALAGIGDRHNASLRLQKLEKLTLERAGINSYQLQRWVERNPNLKELRLRNVLGVDLEFVQWLGRHHSGTDLETTQQSRPARLRTLALESCSSLVINSVEQFSWLSSLFDFGDKSIYEERLALEVLSFRHSVSVSAKPLYAYLETNRPSIRQITLMDGHILIPKRQKKARPKPCTEKLDDSKKGPGGEPTLSASNEQIDGQSQDASGASVDNVATAVETLTINGNQSETESSDDDSWRPCVVSYLRFKNRYKRRKNCNFLPTDIIEPDPDAI
jgi:hypothetical protein